MDLQFNYLRGWIIRPTESGTAAPSNTMAGPLPFVRARPGNANDGKPKFNPHRFDEDCFKLLRARARALPVHGICFSVMLFELCGFLEGEEMNGQRLWDGNPFNGAHKVNGIEVDRNRNRLGEACSSLENQELLKLQQACGEKTVDILTAPSRAT